MFQLTHKTCMKHDLNRTELDYLVQKLLIRAGPT